MPGRLQAEIKQSRPFPPTEEALLNVLRTADAVEQFLVETLKPFGLTPTQYNVLRILRGAGEDGCTCSEIGDRMITRDPDVTRMLDRLEKRGLVRRARDGTDRRVIRTHITEQGLAVLATADAPMNAALKRRLAHLDERDLRVLIAGLEAMRQPRPPG